MYSKGKYIVGEIRGQYPVLTAVCFNELATHSDFKPIFTEILGAGFFHVNDDLTVTVYGDSVSLEVKVRPEDAKKISQALALPGTID